MLLSLGTIIIKNGEDSQDLYSFTFNMGSFWKESVSRDSCPDPMLWPSGSWQASKRVVKVQL